MEGWAASCTSTGRKLNEGPSYELGKPLTSVEWSAECGWASGRRHAMGWLNDTMKVELVGMTSSVEGGPGVGASAQRVRQSNPTKGGLSWMKVWVGCMVVGRVVCFGRFCKKEVGVPLQGLLLYILNNYHYYCGNTHLQGVTPPVKYVSAVHMCKMIMMMKDV